MCSGGGGTNSAPPVDGPCAWAALGRNRMMKSNRANARSEDKLSKPLSSAYGVS